MSIATRIQSMEEHISDAYDSLSKFGVAAPSNKNIENIASLVDEIYDNTPKTDYTSGTNLTLENARVGKIDFKDTDNIEKIGFGATNQYTTTGKNLLNYNTFVKGRINSSTGQIEYANNVTSIIIDNNVITFTVTQAWNSGIVSDFIPVEQGYYIYKGTFGVIKGGVYIDLYDADKTWLSRYGNQTINANETKTWTININDENAKYIRLHYEVNTAGTTTITNSQLEKGTTATSYEKYSGGKASPNPDFPQDVSNVTGSIGIKTSNKNLIENETFVQGSFNGNNSNRISCRNIKLKANTTYTFSSNLNYSTYNAAIVTSTNQFPIQLSETPKYDSGWKTASFSFTTGNDDVYANIAVKKVGELAITPSDVAGYHFQIEKGTTATSYVKYYKQEYELNLGKNLFNKDDAQIIHAWFLKASTAISVNSGNDTIVYIPCQPNTTYTASKIQEPNQSKNTLVLGTTTTQPTNNTPLNVKEGQQGGTITQVTITTGPNDYYLCAFCYSKNDANTYNETEMLASLQIEEGSQATSYVSYFPPIELCKIGKYQDYIFKNGKNWYLHKEIEKIALNGTESWVLDGALTNTNRFRLDITSYNIQNIAVAGAGFSNQLRIVNAYSDESEHLYTYKPSYMNLYVFYNKTRCADLAGLQTYLSANNLIIYGILNTSKETPITNENLITQLNAWYNAQSMDDTTYITVDGNLPMQLKLRALKK